MKKHLLIILLLSLAAGACELISTILSFGSNWQFADDQTKQIFSTALITGLYGFMAAGFVFTVLLLFKNKLENMRIKIYWMWAINLVLWIMLFVVNFDLNRQMTELDTNVLLHLYYPAFNAAMGLCLLTVNALVGFSYYFSIKRAAKKKAAKEAKQANLKQSNNPG